jgi:hypothetical protein
MALVSDNLNFKSRPIMIEACRLDCGASDKQAYAQEFPARLEQVTI